MKKNYLLIFIFLNFLLPSQYIRGHSNNVFEKTISKNYSKKMEYTGTLFSITNVFEANFYDWFEDPPCTPATIPFFEGFETGHTHYEDVESCWISLSITDGDIWTANSSYTSFNRGPRTGTWNAFLTYDSDSWMFRSVQLEAGTNYKFTMFARQDETTEAEIKVNIGSQATASSMTTPIVPLTPIVNGDYQKLEGYFQVPTTGVYYLGIFGSVEWEPYYLSIDDISLEVATSCIEPSIPVISQLSFDSVTVNWTSMDSLANYIWEIRTSGEPGAPNPVLSGTETAGTLSRTLNGLANNTAYQFYIRANCGDGDLSSWTEQVNFKTLKLVPSPWQESFQETSTPTDWTMTDWSIGSTYEIDPIQGNYLHKDFYYEYDYWWDEYDEDLTGTFSSVNIGPILEDDIFSFQYNLGLDYWSDEPFGPGSGNIKIELSTDLGNTYVVASTLQNNGVEGWQEYSFPLTNYVGQILKFKISVMINNQGDDLDSPIAFDKFEISNINSCIAPLVNEISDITVNSANVSWIKPSSINNTGYIYELRTSGEPGSGDDGFVLSDTINDADTLTVILNEISHSTDYVFYIKTLCSEEDSSAWSQGRAFKTPLILTTPWQENFITTTTPQGWNKTGWNIGTASSLNADAEGNYLHKNLYISSSTGTFSTVFIGPILQNDKLSFVYKIADYYSPYASPGTGSGNFKIDISTDFGNTYTPFTTVNNNTINTWQPLEFDLEDYVGETIQLKITATRTSGDYNLGFDKFKISRPCPTVTSFSATNIAATGATIEVTSEATHFDFEYGPTGFTQGQGTVVSGDTPFQLTGLTPETSYDLYVRSNCGNIEYSVWNGPVNFTTVALQPQTITVADITKTYGDEPFTTGSASSELSLSYVVTNQNVAKFENGQLVIVGAGTTEVKAQQAGNISYSPAPEKTFTLTVNKAPLTVKPKDVSKVFDGNAFTPTEIIGEGFVYDENVSVLVGTPLFSGTGVGAVNLGTYVLSVTGLTSNNYTITYGNGQLNITKKPITDITFEGQTLVYDGTPKSILINGELPDGTTVTYENNAKTEIGDYTVVATIDGGADYENLVLEAVMKIRADMSNISFPDATFMYDGTLKTLTLSGILPEGASVTYENNGHTNVGTYEVIANIDGGDDYADMSLTAELQIEKASLANSITLEDATYVYDGEAKALTLTGDLPEETSVVFTGNNKTNAGIYPVSVSIDAGSNYELLNLEATLTIEKAIIENITFSDLTVGYDGGTKSLLIQGDLPEGATVTYEGNNQVNVGVYPIIATISGDNFETTTLEATLTIEKGIIDWITFEDTAIGYDGTLKTLSITGTLPQGATVSYTNNTATELGSYNATATISGGANYNDLVLTAQLIIKKGIINGVYFPNGTFTYDGTSKSIAITGTLPAGTSVTYQNNNQINAGLYPVIATVHGGTNYNDLILTANLIINKIPITGITFEGASFDYDGTPKFIYISGTLPENANVTYQNNGKTNAGTHEVVANIQGGTNYIGQQLKANIKINTINQVITFDALAVLILEEADDFQLQATASSNLDVRYTFEYSTPTPAAKVSETGFVTLNHAGIIRITAHQAGNINYSAAASVTRELEIESTNATIDALWINGTLYKNPSQEIHYVIACDQMTNQVVFKLEAEANVSIDPGTEFTMQVQHPGTYKQTFTATSASGKVKKEYHITVEKPFDFDKIAVQKFNNTLLINNNPKTNGGFKFVGYKWFKNDELIGENQVYSAGNSATDLLDPNAKYHAEVTTEAGEVYQVCPITFETKGSFAIRLFPSPAQQGGKLTLYVNHPNGQFDDTVLQVFDMKGQKVFSKEVRKEQTSFELPATIQRGVYIAIVRINNKQEAIKFIVE